MYIVLRKEATCLVVVSHIPELGQRMEDSAARGWLTHTADHRIIKNTIDFKNYFKKYFPIVYIYIQEMDSHVERRTRFSDIRYHIPYDIIKVIKNHVTNFKNNDEEYIIL